MSNQKLIGVVVGLMLAVAIVMMVQTQRQPITVGDSMVQGVGDAAVEQTGKLLGNHGRIVVVAAADCAMCEQTMKLRQIFGQSVRRAGKLTVVGTELVPLTDDSQLSLPGDVYARILESHPDVDAVVSLIGVPAMKADRVSKGNSRLVVVASNGDHDQEIKRLMEARIVDLAIIPRTTRAPDAPANPKTPREWFDFNYQVVTPETAAALTP
ncbi:MAG TPA: hypothetical protein VMV72_10740 [Verrucomicrobiae bacterium]|nr:hypothetical protein [Verrucomicrobiae bacterium]